MLSDASKLDLASQWIGAVNRLAMKLAPGKKNEDFLKQLQEAARDNTETLRKKAAEHHVVAAAEAIETSLKICTINMQMAGANTPEKRWGLLLSNFPDIDFKKSVTERPAPLFAAALDLLLTKGSGISPDALLAVEKNLKDDSMKLALYYLGSFVFIREAALVSKKSGGKEKALAMLGGTRKLIDSARKFNKSRVIPIVGKSDGWFGQYVDTMDKQVATLTKQLGGK